MKKVLGGCLALVLIGVVALGLALFYGYRAARPMIDNARGMLEQGREMAALSDRVTNKSDYVPPATGELSDAQVRRLLAVHTHVRQALGPRWSELQTRATAVESKARQGGGDLSFTEIGAMLSEFGGLLREARRAHVDALNAEAFSNREYTWVRLRVFEAAGLEVARGIDWSSLEDLIKKGSEQSGVPVPPVSLPDVPEKNRELVKAHIAELKEWMPLALFGF
jgi:hypothetical protein